MQRGDSKACVTCRVSSSMVLQRQQFNRGAGANGAVAEGAVVDDDLVLRETLVSKWGFLGVPRGAEMRGAEGTVAVFK